MASYKSPSLSVCVGYDVTSPACRSRCAAQAVEPGFGEPLFVPSLWSGTEGINGNSWVQVAMRGTTSGKVEGCAHQATVHYGAQAVYSLGAYANGDKFCVYETVCALSAAVSNALPVFGCFRRRCEKLQPLESRLTELVVRLHGPRVIAQLVVWMLE